MGRKVSQKDGTKRLDSFALHAPEHTFAQRLAALSPLSLYFPRSRTLNAHSTHMPNLVEGGLRHTRHPSALRVHHDVGRDVVLNVVQLDGHVVSRVRVLWLGLGQDGSSMSMLSVPQPSWPSPVRLAILAHAQKSERQVCGPDLGNSSQLCATHARFWKSHFVLFLRSWRHPDSHAGALQKGSKTEHLEIESRQTRILVRRGIF